MKKIFQFILMILLCVSCSQSEDVFINQATIVDTSSNLSFVDSSKDFIDSFDALKVATLFNLSINNEKGNTRVANSSANISTINDSKTGQPLLYIANYGDNNGFAIISSTKKTCPIFAYSQKGHLDKDIIVQDGINEFIEAYKAIVCDASKETTDSLMIKHAIEWAQYEKTWQAEKPKTRSASDAEELRQQEIQRMTSLGYTYVGDITTLQNYVSSTSYQQIVQNVASNAHPDYDYEECSLFFLKYTEPYNIQPLINVEWHQFNPFNVDAPNSYAGCVPVAVAQIMFYHKYPTYFNWSQIYAVPVLNDSFKTFIKDVRDQCQVVYNSNSTSSTITKARNALIGYGYSVTQYDNYNGSTISNSIINSNPVYMQGVNSSSVGHAWVCEGYKKTQYEAVLAAIYNRPLVRYTESPIDISWQPNETYYMAFGSQGGYGNGWFSYQVSDFPINPKCLIISK